MGRGAEDGWVGQPQRPDRQTDAAQVNTPEWKGSKVARSNTMTAKDPHEAYGRLVAQDPGTDGRYWALGLSGRTADHHVRTARTGVARTSGVIKDMKNNMSSGRSQGGFERGERTG